MQTQTMNAQGGAQPVDGRAWRGPQVCRLAGITYRQLDYWARRGIVVPSIAEANGSGTWRLYSTADVCAAALLARLASMGVRLDSVSAVTAALQQVPLGLWPHWVVVTRDGLLVEITDVLTAESGDLDVCWLVNLRSVVADVEQRAADLG